MKYDFETMISRAGTGSSKWNLMYSINPDVPSDIVPFSVADMELKNPPEVVSGLQKYVGEVVMGYTNPGDSFFNAVKGWMKRRHGWDIESDWIVATPGVVAAFFIAVNAFTKKGEGVIVMPPVYYPFYMAIEFNERNVVSNPLLYQDGDYTIDYDGLEACVKDPANHVLLFSSPHNPVGRVWTEEELRRVGDLCNANDVLMLSDEIHGDLIMPGYKHTVYATLGEAYKNNCMVLTAPSKTFNLAGLQGSNIIIPDKDIREAYCKQIRNQTSLTRLNMFAYKACEIAYNESEEWLNQLIEHIHANYNFLKAFMAEYMPKVDVIRLEGTYLVWMDFRSYKLEPKELERIMQKEALLFLDEGYIFGTEGNGFERINIACPKDVLEAALIRLRSAMKKYEQEEWNMRITAGGFMEDFTVSTPYREHVALSEIMEGNSAVLYFLRYYGCTLCQMDMHAIAQDYPRYKERGVKVFVVLQSAPETIRGQLSEDYEPFTVICDENQTLYKQLGIEPAKSVEELIGGDSAEKITKAKSMGFEHGEYEGEELQLPAVFVLDNNRKVLFSHYGSNAADIPVLDTILGSV